MQYRTLGRTGLLVSEISFGGVGAMGKYGPVTPEAFDEVMSRACELGVNLLDTAPAYGQSQRVFGYHLAHNRDKWLICTKVGLCGPGNGSARGPDATAIMESFPRTLAELRADHVDILLIHSIEQYGHGAAAVEKVLGRGGLVDRMRALQREGRVRFIGVSGHVPELCHAVRTGEFDVALTYNSFNLLVQGAERELFPAARGQNVGILLGGALYQGLLAGLTDFLVERKRSFFEKCDPAFYDTQRLVARAERLLAYFNGDGKALRHAAIRFSLSDPAVSALLSAMYRTEQVEENCAASDLPRLTASEIEALLAV